MNFATTVLLVTVLLITILFGAAALYASFFMKRFSSNDEIDD
jgi:type IV secretory pathway VirB2 component (pilin)